MLPNLPGFLKTAAPDAFAWIGAGWAAAYAYAWFIGLAVALVVYAALMWRPKSVIPSEGRGRMLKSVDWDRQPSPGMADV